jgi:hypothetical protein
MPDLIPSEDFGPSKPVDLDDMFGPEPDPDRFKPLQTSREAWRLWAEFWGVDLKEEKK